jgi:bifunctional DNA-binding transcriptional regulator/antitoxin component of YhaV-PrlF toxin-antitoxin module
MLVTITLSSNYQITTPKSVREEMRWQKRRQLALMPKGNRLLLMPMLSFQQLQGIAA